MNREEEIKLIIEELSKLKTIIEVENKLNLTNKNIYLEDFLGQLVNIIYGYSLKNTNFNISNFPCIDLIDEEKKIAIQITTNVNHSKIQTSLDKFFENEYDKKIEQIKFVVFKETQYRKDFKLQREFKFNKETDIITFNKLLKDIIHIDDVKLKKIYDFVNFALVKKIYTTEWMLDNTNKSLRNLGKRYNRILNVYNDEEEKLEAFLLEKNVKEKILKLLLELIIDIENNGVYTSLDIEELKSKFSLNLLERIKNDLNVYKNKVLNKKQDYIEKWNYESEYNRKIEKIEFLSDIFNKKILIYKGEAGIGKSHTVAHFLYKEFVSKNIPAILLLGQDFVTSENIEIQISKNLGFQENLKTFCEYINHIAKIRNIIIPIVIDGINESKDKEIWKRGLNNFIEIISSYTNLKLVLSLRETYYNTCISEEIEKVKELKILKHNGFGNKSFEAAKEFFEFYNIAIPITQIINREFSNPLFLNIFCEIVSKYQINIDEFKYDNFVNIYEEYLQKVNEVIVNKYDILTKKNIVKECLYAIVKDSINNSNYGLYEDVLNSIKEIADLYDISKTKLLGELIDNGILYKEIVKNEEILIFTYERYEKIAKAEYLLNNIENLEKLSFEINNGELNKYFDESDKFDQGVLEELLIIIPMRYKEDVFKIVDFKNIKFKYFLEVSYIRSIIWLKGYYKEDVIFENLKKLTREDYINEIINVLIKCSYISSNPCNINLIHNNLIKLTMAELDYKWTIIIDDYYENFTSTTIDDLINYCLIYGNEYLDNETTYLMAKMLIWFLSSNNRGVRDKATKALVKILINKNEICLKIIDEFKEVKDLYILERIIAVMYGTIIRSEENSCIDKLAQTIYNLVYKGKETVDNIIIKIYSKKLFAFLKDKFKNALYDQIEFEKKSKWYNHLPTNEELDKEYKFDIEECSKDNRKFANCKIIDSMVTEYGRGVCSYGDFGRYTLQPMLWAFEYIFDDIQLLANIATKRVFEYGYNFELFGAYDNAIKMNEIRNRHYIERIGKKYQWIAVYELLSKLYDNFSPHYEVYSDTLIDFDKRKYFDKNHKEVKDKTKVKFVEYLLEEEYPHVIYLDTTNFILKQNYKNKYLEEKNFDFEEEDYHKYLIKELDNEKYISLFNLHTTENRKAISKIENRKEITIFQTAFIYESKEKLKNSNYRSFSKGQYVEIYNMELFDISYSKKFLLKDSYNQEYFNIENGYKVCYQEYIWEQYQDESIEETIKIVLPAKWIVDAFNLKQKNEGMWYKDNELICFDGGLNNFESGLWIKYDYFIKYINKNNLKIGWTIYSEKSSGKFHKHWRSDVFFDVKNSRFDVLNYDKDEWEMRNIF